MYTIHLDLTETR